MKRRSLSNKARAALFAQHGGRCHLCGGKIGVGEAWEVEHRVALAMGGEDGGDNLALAHVKCHRTKTADDVANLYRAIRRENRAKGVHRPRNPMPGSRFSAWKKRMDGSVVKREQGR